MLELDSAVPTTLAAAGSAAVLAQQNWKGNLAALAANQPDLTAALAQIQPSVESIFARDGTLTALEKAKWWGGCSVPAKAAEELLKSLHITAAMACFLAPSHPAQIAFALDQLKPEQAIVAVVPHLNDLALSLHCQDFSIEISSHRLWFSAGKNWRQQIGQIFESNPGLAIPQQFIRTALLNDDASAPLIATAQKLFSDELSRRSNLLTQIRHRRPTITHRKRFTIASNMCFRLWDDAGAILQQLTGQLSDSDRTLINFDDPIHASPLALAEAAAESDAVIAANLTRADCSNFLQPDIPLITWLTTRALPAFDSSAARDFLLLPDQRILQLAKESGWPPDRLRLLPWPSIASSTESNTLTIIADTRPIDPSPPFDLSSHQLLWDLIRSELQSDPTLIKNDALAYLHSRMKRLNVSDHGLDHRRFIEALIIPAYQQSLAAHLLSAKIPLRIFGQGWSQIPHFAPAAAGPICSREQLKQALGTSATLIHLWPSGHPHPIDSAGPPVLRLTSRGPSGLVADARLALKGNLIKPTPPAADSTDKAPIAHILRAILAS
jgi:hypothetical protein